MSTRLQLIRAALTGAVLALMLFAGVLLPKCEGPGPHPFTRLTAHVSVLPRDPFPRVFGLELGTGEPGIPAARQPKYVYECRSYWYEPSGDREYGQWAVTCRLMLAPVP